MQEYIWAILIILVIVIIASVNHRHEEKKRVEEILSHQSEWGHGVCQWLIKSKFNLSTPRTKKIMSKFQEWGENTCMELLNKRIAIDMTVEMITLSLGEPNNIDNKEVTAKDEKYRYIYGVPRQGATYVWFKNGRVTKIKQ